MVTVNTSMPKNSSHVVSDTAAELIGHLLKDRPVEEAKLIHAAFQIAEKAHHGQKRASGDAYIRHSVTVANILADIKMDSETIAAALLHDVVEDSSFTLEDIASQFGAGIARLVNGVTKMAKIANFSSASEGATTNTHADSQRKLLLAMADDMRVVLIKLADRLHNMRTLNFLPEDKQKRIAQETLDIYAPLASRLGIWTIKWELEDLSFRYLHPDQYKSIAKQLDERRVDREQYIQKVISTLENELKHAGIEAQVTGRPKHIYSIWRKMQRKSVPFSEIFDTRAVRILTTDVATCYSALGIVHTLWNHIPREFDDYIATPKGNNYQSLHTAVIGPDRKVLEIQIRTFNMHNHAELGVAAHWKYKEGNKGDASFEQKVAWLRQILEWKDEESNADDFIDRFKTEIFEDRVYVITPKGTILDLAKGATPLDFAYHIHTELGHRCRGAKIDGHIVPLTYELKSGQQVEVLTTKHPHPSRDWLSPHLGYIKTSRARSKVKQWFRHQDIEHNITAGRTTVDTELSRLNVSNVAHHDLAEQLKFTKTDDFYAAVGRGDITGTQIANAVQRLTRTVEEESVDQKERLLRKPSTGKTDSDITVLGVGNLMTNMARCCKPVPPDPITGFITQTRGITIHRQDCPNVLGLPDEKKKRLIEVSWGSNQQHTYPIDIEIQAFDRQGLLRDVTTVFAQEKIAVTAMQTHTDKNSGVKMVLTLEIAEIGQLSRLLDRLTQLPNVMKAHRKTH